MKQSAEVMILAVSAIHPNKCLKNGNSLDYRSIQIGLRGQAVRKYVDEWIVNLTDITEFVRELKQKRDEKQDILRLLPDEKVYQIETEKPTAILMHTSL